jgi:membrane-bound serine protease (ClpP class)
VHPLRSLLAAAAVAGLALIASAPAIGQEQAPRVRAIVLENDINPVTADYVIEQIERAENDRYDAVVILLDTPGGLAEAMRDIYKRMLASPLPVIVYVWPDGARAASAGVWIGQAGDILAMAPQTNLGSSTPIAAGGGDIPDDLRTKVVNDAAKSLRSLAEAHGRNGAWAERAVRQAANLSAPEALEQNVIDLIAADLETLLLEIDGQTTKGTKGIVLDTAGAAVDTVEMSLWERVLDTTVDPNIITLLLSLGALAITVELFNPGLIFPAAFGAISMIVGLFGLQVLPFSWAGALLMVVAFSFFIAEAFVASHGALAVAGAVAFVLGALMLFDPAGDSYQVSLGVAIAIAVTLLSVVVFALTKAAAVRKAPKRTGAEEMLGQAGVVREALAPEGLVFAHGELWRARAVSGEPLPAGTPVRVRRMTDGLMLEVEPAGDIQPDGPQGLGLAGGTAS